MTPAPLIDTAAAAARLGRPARTLEDWRYRKTGPPYYRPGGRVRYDADELEAWLKRHRHAA